jgi:hypothetical protein
LARFFCAQHIHVLGPFGACGQKRSRRFYGSPSLATTPVGLSLHGVKNAFRAFFMAGHPWRPPFGPLLRNVKNDSRPFFVFRVNIIPHVAFDIVCD